MNEKYTINEFILKALPREICIYQEDKNKVD